MRITAYDLAGRLAERVKERPGVEDDPFILFCLETVGLRGMHDETAWCSALAATVLWLLGVRPQSFSGAARSWLQFGRAVTDAEARVGWDLVIIKRGPEPQPGPEVLKAQGHVGFFAGFDGEYVLIRGGNQSNQITTARFPRSAILGIRRLYEEA